MVHIKALRGWLYNKKKIKDFARVITPPNDIISKAQKEELKKRSGYNFVKLILPDGNENKYENSAKLFAEWQKQGIFEQDKNEHIYLYSQTYKVNNRDFTRTGFIALLKLEDLGKGVLPHEKIIEKDLKERIEITAANKADMEIPFLLYDDREKIIDKRISEEIDGKMPLIEFTDDNKVMHRLWKSKDKEFQDKLKDEMKKYNCIIADGHHRYTAELKVKEILGEQYGLMCFVNSFNEGLIILPTNRVVFGLDSLDMAAVLDELEKYFDIEELKDVKALIEKIEKTEVMLDKIKNLKNHVLGIYSNLNKKSYLLKLRHVAVLNKLMPGKTDIYRKIDVNILHKIVLENILKITEEQQKNREHIEFIKGNNETMEKIKDKNIQLAFFVNPPLMREVFLTARANETMPQKSTYFYPKVYSGLVIYKFWGK